MAVCSVLKIIMRWGSVSAVYLAYWARCRWILIELIFNSIISIFFMVINGVRSILKIFRKLILISLLVIIVILTMVILVLMKLIFVIGIIIVVKKVKFNLILVR